MPGAAAAKADRLVTKYAALGSYWRRYAKAYHKGMSTVPAKDNFRINLRAALKARGISFRELAERLEIHHPYISDVLNGKTIPNVENCEKLANGAGFELRDLLLEPEIFSQLLLTPVQN